MGITTRQLVEIYQNRGYSREAALRLACGDGGAAVEKKNNPYAPFRSKTELAYSGYLSQLQTLKQIYSWEYEPKPAWRLGYRCFYLPDFKVVLHSGDVEWHEVKGRRSDGRYWARDKAMTKPKAAASKWPDRALFVAWPADRRMTTWEKERIKP
jgi:hypothetical protein